MKKSNFIAPVINKQRIIQLVCLGLEMIFKNTEGFAEAELSAKYFYMINHFSLVGVLYIFNLYSTVKLRKGILQLIKTFTLVTRSTSIWL